MKDEEIDEKHETPDQNDNGHGKEIGPDTTEGPTPGGDGGTGN